MLKEKIILTHTHLSSLMEMLKEGSDTQRRSAAQPGAGLTAGERSSGGRRLSRLCGNAKEQLRSRKPSSKEQQAGGW
ncbi:hypothetical protein QTO34_015105 [Cnephaeus nilssonii]|uniref:Uncharacterized protein n=1 Tax=Cnephaeus nilssonii TaxID=3371016 RepID=A0AA40LSI5_CNENI|nr:hypothetical protein QTO34_015105 [Eptesicus nilssonii]